MSVGVGRIFESVCLSVCQQHNSKTNDPKVLKLGNMDWPWDTLELLLLGFKGHRVNKCIFRTDVRNVTKKKRMFPKCSTWYKQWPWDILQVKWFWVERSKVNVRVKVKSNTAWVWTLWVPSSWRCGCLSGLPQSYRLASDNTLCQITVWQRLFLDSFFVA